MRDNLPIPVCLLPVWSDPLVVGRPLWLTSPPHLFFYDLDRAITLDDVRFRDRYGMIWTVKRGFPNDGMSYPFFITWGKFDQLTLRSGVTHDFRYSMRDYFYFWFDTFARANEGFSDGLGAECPERRRICLAGVKLGGYSVWEHKSREKMMEQWLSVVDYPTQLDAWIQGVIAANKNNPVFFSFPRQLFSPYLIKPLILLSFLHKILYDFC